MKSFLLSSLVLLLCAGCGAAHTIAKGPDGQDLHIIHCELSIEACYAKANEVCSNGYTINNQAELPYITQYGGSTIREMVIECK